MLKLAAQPGTRPSATSNSSAGWDPSYIVLVDTGVLFPAKVAICCRRVLGCHPLLGCMEEELGGM